MSTSQSVERRFHSSYTVDSETGCWVWTASLTDGLYGRIYVNGKRMRANRYSLQLRLGRDLLPTEQALHTCDNSLCVNWSHLYPGTPKQNVADMISRGRSKLGHFQSSKTHCGKGHEFTSENTYIYGPKRNKRQCRACSRERWHRNKTVA